MRAPPIFLIKKSQTLIFSLVSFDAKRRVCGGLTLAILLCGSETWFLTEELLRDLRLPRACCTRAMCRVNMRHTRCCRISSDELQSRLKLKSIDAYASRRQLQRTGHVWGMAPESLPRGLLSSWVPNGRPRGCPEYT